MKTLLRFLIYVPKSMAVVIVICMTPMYLFISLLIMNTNPLDMQDDLIDFIKRV